MKIALAQINTTIGDLEGNVRRILDMAGSVSGADLIVFPEMAVPGYPPRDILYDSTFIEAVQAANLDLAKRAKGLPPLLVGSFAPSGEKLYQHPALHNVAYLIQDGKLQVAQVKQNLPVYDVFYEPRWFIPGKKTMPPIEIANKRIGVIICEDMWDEKYPVHPGADLKALGAEALVCLSASPFRRNGWKGREYHARRQSLPLAFVNLVGGNDELIFDGGSFVLGGENLERFQEQIKIVDMDKKCESAPLDGDESVYNALVLGLSDFARKNGLRRAHLGLSGGIDSAVAAVLSAEALGADNITGIAIPSRFTDPRSTESARELAEGLGIRFETVELEKMRLAAEQALGPERSGGVGGENIQARLRMIVLMSYVNQQKGFLINTSNKTELTLGYSTLYGDMAGTISPLGDLTKPEVYALARYINRRKKIIPDFILERKPSAELREGQVDPFDYDAISPEMESLVITNRSNGAMLASEHKRWQMGIVLKVSEKSFGTGRMMPVTRK